MIENDKVFKVLDRSRRIKKKELGGEGGGGGGG